MGGIQVTWSDRQGLRARGLMGGDLGHVGACLTGGGHPLPPVSSDHRPAAHGSTWPPTAVLFSSSFCNFFFSNLYFCLQPVNVLPSGCHVVMTCPLSNVPELNLQVFICCYKGSTCNDHPVQSTVPRGRVPGVPSSMARSGSQLHQFPKP